MKRHRPSGAEGRKIKKKREEEAKSLSGALYRFVHSTPLDKSDTSKCVKGETSSSQSEENKEDQVETLSNHSEENKQDNVLYKADDGISIEDVCETKEGGVVKAKGNEEGVIENITDKSQADIQREKDDGADEINFYSDVGDWPLPLPNDLKIEILRRGSDSFQNKDGSFTAAQRSGKKTKGENRQLTKGWFYKDLPNGETILRKWMIYSPSKQMLYCFCCRLFSSDFKEAVTTKFISGFDKWWKLNPKIFEHENSERHLSCLEKWKTLVAQLKSEKTIDSLHQQEKDLQKRKWRDVLHRLLYITLFLSKQNLPFGGHREDDLSENRGNFLELVHLLSNYDPVLKEHLVLIHQAGPSHKVMTSYLSGRIQNEFINVLGGTVKDKILKDIKNARYFGILFDSAPDVSNSDQMSEVIRYVHIENSKVEIRESFLGFFPLSGKKAEDITSEILKNINEDGLDINLCRAQGYDNASTMAGVHTGVQARILELNPKALFVPCANHSLNLCGVHAFATVPSCVTFFGTFESIYNFFSASTHRWDVLLEVVGVSVKRLCETRWSAHHEAVKPVMRNFPKIVQAVEKLSDPSENLDTRSASAILMTAICDFTFLTYLFLWAHLLEGTQKYLQIEGLTVDKSLKKMKALQLFLEESRKELPNNALIFAQQICEDLNIPVQRKGRIKRKTIMPGEKVQDVGLTLKEDLKISMLECLDRFTQELQRRSKSMETICSTFSCVESPNLVTASDDVLVESASSLTNKMDEIERESLLVEIKHLRRHLAAADVPEEVAKNWSSLQMLQFIVNFDFQESLPNVFLALKLFLTVCVSVSTCERSFSKLKIIKNYLRSSMSQIRLNNLSLLSIENRITESIDFNDVINKFAEAKVRKARM